MSFLHSCVLASHCVRLLRSRACIHQWLPALCPQGCCSLCICAGLFPCWPGAAAGCTPTCSTLFMKQVSHR
jgi:hypothetical protein